MVVDSLAYLTDNFPDYVRFGNESHHTEPGECKGHKFLWSVRPKEESYHMTKAVMLQAVNESYRVDPGGEKPLVIRLVSAMNQDLHNPVNDTFGKCWTTLNEFMITLLPNVVHRQDSYHPVFGVLTPFIMGIVHANPNAGDQNVEQYLNPMFTDLIKGLFAANVVSPRRSLNFQCYQYLVHLFAHYQDAFEFQMGWTTEAAISMLNSYITMEARANGRAGLMRLIFPQ
jgi:hypothetical protein